MSAFPAPLDELAARERIRDQQYRYCRSVDRKDHDLLRSCYWPEAYDDHILYQGDVDGLIAYTRSFTQDMPTHHFIGNLLIEFSCPDHAFVETYFQAYHLVEDDAGKRDLVVFGRYLDDFEKRGNEWRIARRICTMDAYTDGPATSDLANGPLATATHVGAGKPDDALYTYNARLLTGVDA